MNAKKVFSEFNSRMVRLLPSRDPYFTALLTQQGLVSGALKEEMMATSTRADATTHFLQKVVERSLDIEDREPFDKLLLVMEKFGNLTLHKLANEIKQKLTNSDSCTEPGQPNDSDNTELPKTTAKSASDDMTLNNQTSQELISTKEIPPFTEALQSGHYHIKWTPCADLPSPMYDTYVAVSNGTIYCTSSSPNEDRQHNVYSYDIKSNQWKQLPRSGHFLGVIHMVDDKLTIFGGMDSTTYNIHNKVTTYNNKTNSWYRCYPDMLRKRYRPGVITSHNYMIVMGGKSDPYTVLDRIELMDYRDKLQWKEVSIHLPEPMWAIKPTISGGYITIVGYSNTRGRNKGYYHIAAQELFSSLDRPLATDAVSPRWKRVSIAMHYDTTVVPYSNPPVVIGGGSRGGIVLTSNIMLYDTAKKLWIKVASLTSARDCVGVAMLNDNSMIIIGGTRGGETVEGALASSLTTVEIGSIVPNK